MIRAVLFDIGGPIDLEFQFEAAIDANMRAGLASEGFEISDDDWQAANRRAVETLAPNLYRSVIWQLTGGNLAASTRVYDWMHEQAVQPDLF